MPSPMLSSKLSLFIILSITYRIQLRAEGSFNFPLNSVCLPIFIFLYDDHTPLSNIYVHNLSFYSFVLISINLPINLSRQMQAVDKLEEFYRQQEEAAKANATLAESGIVILWPILMYHWK